jgi:hypothetical protein
VPITGTDAFRLSARLQLPYEAFARLSHSHADARGAFRLSADDRFWRLALQHREGTSACVLLMELPNAAGRCGVYAARPDVCQVFPLALEEGIPVVREDVPCPPGRWEPVDHGMWRPLLDRSELEWQIYQTVLGRWSAWASGLPASDPAEPAMFLAWLHDLYRRLQDVRAEIGEAGLLEATADVEAFVCGDRSGPAADLIARCVWAAGDLPGEVL